MLTQTLALQGALITHGNILAAVQGLLRRAADDGVPLTEIHSYLRSGVFS